MRGKVGRRCHHPSYSWTTIEGNLFREMKRLLLNVSKQQESKRVWKYVRSYWRMWGVGVGGAFRVASLQDEVYSFMVKLSVGFHHLASGATGQRFKRRKPLLTG